MRKLVLTSAICLPLLCSAQTTGIATTSMPAAPAGTISSRAQVGDRLHLTAAQQEDWAQYVARLDAYSKLFYEEKPVAAYASDTAVRQFARLTDALQNRLAALEEIESAAKHLYATLSPTQQSIANQWLVSTVPVFASAASCVPTDNRPRDEKREGAQRIHRGGAGMGGISN